GGGVLRRRRVPAKGDGAGAGAGGRASVMIELSALRRRLLREAAWVFAGQLSSAVGTMVGLRWLTEWVPPSVYGSVALANGVIALAQGLTVGPMMQAVLRFY